MQGYGTGKVIGMRAYKEHLMNQSSEIETDTKGYQVKYRGNDHTEIPLTYLLLIPEGENETILWEHTSDSDLGKIFPAHDQPVQGDQEKG